MSQTIRGGALIQSCPHYQDFSFVILKITTDSENTGTATLCQVSPLAIPGKLQNRPAHRGLGRKDLREKCCQERNTEGWLAAGLTTWHQSETLPGKKLGHRAAEDCRAQNYGCKKPKFHSATCQLLSVHLHSLSITNTVSLLGLLSSRLHRAAGRTITISSRTNCRTRKLFWTCSFSSTLPVDLP